MGPFSRRALIKTAAASGVSVNLAGSASLAAHSAAPQTFVLVHGAWHGGWCWRDVVPLLTREGHRVYTPTLTGLGERYHLRSPSIDLSVHTADIVNVIEFEGLENVVLVGHSYAGYVISMVADRIKDKLKRLIYLDAVLPTEGQPFIAPEQQTALRAASPTDLTLPPPGLDFLGVPQDHPSSDWLQSKLRPHPLGSLFQVVRYENGGPAGMSRTFIRCTRSAFYSAEKDANQFAAPDWIYATIDSGHNAMVTAPEILAGLVESNS